MQSLFDLQQSQARDSRRTAAADLWMSEGVLTVAQCTVLVTPIVSMSLLWHNAQIQAAWKLHWGSITSMIGGAALAAASNLLWF
jgi:hypothetical protein